MFPSTPTDHIGDTQSTRRRAVPQYWTHRTLRGFSLLEIALVVAVLGVLMAVAVPTLVGHRKNGDDRVAQAHLDATRGLAQEELAFSSGAFPSELATGLSDSTLTFTTSVSTGPETVSINVIDDDNAIYAAESDSGKCWVIYDHTNRPPTYGVTDGSCGASSIASGAVAGADWGEARTIAISGHTVDFSRYEITGYGGQDEGGTYAVLDDGGAIGLYGNAWKKIAFTTTIEPETILEFDYTSTTQGEIQGIGFVPSDALFQGHIFQLFGTQAWGLSDYHDYTIGDTKHYVIPIGTYYTGTYDYMVVTNDHDGGLQNADGVYSNVVISTPEAAS